MTRLLALGLALVLPVAACAGRPSVPDEAARPFVLEDALVGRTIGEGTFSTITGVRRAFTATLDGSWDGETLTLVEDFLYDDGETDRKTWRLTKTGAGTYVGTREDVVGEAIGFQDGDAFRLEYLVDIPTDGGGARRVGFRDVLVRTDDGAVLNRARVGWRGLHVGRVELVIQPAADVSAGDREALDP